MGEYEKGFRNGYLMMIALAVIEGIVFIISGVCLAMLPSWEGKIVGGLLIIFGAASLMSAFKAAESKAWAKAVYEGQEFDKPVSEMFSDMEATTLDTPETKEEEDE